MAYQVEGSIGHRGRFGDSHRIAARVEPAYWADGWHRAEAGR
ncbi:hypothetical protein [Halanaeroarchaeum sulfurireducens]|nr:hypothetical protein [Halanaeroarchaeum sulfurireducens]